MCLKRVAEEPQSGRPSDKRQELEGCQSGRTNVDEMPDKVDNNEDLSLGAAQQILRGSLASLLVYKSDVNFPMRCLQVVRDEIAPILSSGVNTRDSLLIRVESGDGRNLSMILLLAAAVATSGFSVLQADRNAYDSVRTQSTRNWISFCKKGRKTCTSLCGLSTTKWSSIRQAFQEEDAMTDLDDAIVACFQQHDDATSITDLDNLGSCAVCDITYENAQCDFFECAQCDLLFCVECESRRINWK
jgi:hypothetical protein